MRGTVSKNVIESTDTFSISFGGEKEIDAVAFSKIIQETVNILQASANSILDANSSYGRTTIKANREGSFETILQIIVDKKDSLLGLIDPARKIVSFLCDCFSIKQFLRGRKPKEVIKLDNEKTKIVNQYDQTITADTVIVKQFFQNSTIDKSVSDIIKEASDINRNNIKIKHKDRTVLISENDYEDMSIPIVEDFDISNSTKTSQINKECVLQIKSLIFSEYRSGRLFITK